MINYQDFPDGCQIPIWVQPRSSNNQVVGEYQGAIKIRLAAPPVDGEANMELCRYLAKCLHLSKSQVTIQQGHTGRNKMVHITGLTGIEVLNRLELGQ